MSDSEKDDKRKSLTDHGGQPSDQEESSEGASAEIDAPEDDQTHLDGMGMAPDEPA